MEGEARIPGVGVAEGGPSRVVGVVEEGPYPAEEEVVAEVRNQVGEEVGVEVQNQVGEEGEEVEEVDIVQAQVRAGEVVEVEGRPPLVKEVGVGVHLQ